jgi:hypothetical protein
MKVFAARIVVNDDAMVLSRIALGVAATHSQR